MIKTIAFMHRKAGITREEFAKHYEETHAPLALTLLPMFRKYARNHVTLSPGAPDPGFDCVSEFWFERIEDAMGVMEVVQSEAGRPLMEDEHSFIDSGRTVSFLVDEKISALPVIPGKPRMRRWVKAIALLKRKPGISREEYIRHYEETHVPLIIKHSPGLVGYARNHVMATGPDEPEFDTITELWYKDLDAFNASVKATRTEGEGAIPKDETSFLDMSKVKFFLVNERISRIPAVARLEAIPGSSLEGKVAIITGASRGIGNALANGFADAGAAVVLVARSPAELESTVREIESRGGEVLAVPTDVTDGAQVSQMVRRAMDAFGRIDVLINCAGGTGADRSIPLTDMDEAIWDRIVDLNLKSVYLCCRAVGKIMAEQKSGSIVNFSSGAAVHPVWGMTHYGSAKSGIVQLTRVLAVELGPYNVRVNAISPGLIDTATERKWMPPEVFEKYAKAVPLGRVGQPEDILGTALYLASDASAYVSGVVIAVGGGPQ